MWRLNHSRLHATAYTRSYLDCHFAACQGHCAMPGAVALQPRNLATIEFVPQRLQRGHWQIYLCCYVEWQPCARKRRGWTGNSLRCVKSQFTVTQWLASDLAAFAQWAVARLWPTVIWILCASDRQVNKGQPGIRFTFIPEPQMKWI